MRKTNSGMVNRGMQGRFRRAWEFRESFGCRTSELVKGRPEALKSKRILGKGIASLVIFNF